MKSVTQEEQKSRVRVVVELEGYAPLSIDECELPEYVDIPDDATIIEWEFV